jgi:hypothetical protein
LGGSAAAGGGGGPEVGKVTLKSNGDEALSNEFLKKSIGDEALNNDPL